MEHITRVARIIDLPRGNAMLVGVGGSGKQSLARLASYICNYEVFQISVSSTYGVTEFKENLLSLYRRVSCGLNVLFLCVRSYLGGLDSIGKSVASTFGVTISKENLLSLY